MLIDTGGWQTKPHSSLDKKIKQQVETAVSEADAIIFVVDVKTGLIASDEEVAEMLRLANKPVTLAVNKVDSSHQLSDIASFYHLGMGEPIPISAYHNRGIEKLMSAVLATLPLQHEATEISEPELPKLAIVGRPNVGKSTLLNALVGEERAIVDEAPGTTRDSVDALVQWGEKRFLLIDTAGIRRRGRVATDVEYYSLLRALQAIERCDVALVMVDAREFVTAQELHIVGYVVEAGKGLMIAINKWDTVPENEKEKFRKSAEERLKFVAYAPTIYISASLREGTNQILPLAWEIYQEREKRLSEAEINAVIKQATTSCPPPRMGTRKLRILGAYQDKTKPATFVLLVNDPELVHFSYRRYLENRLRQHFGFRGVPLRLVFTQIPRKVNNREEAKIL
jgi:GTP-binding protein